MIRAFLVTGFATLAAASGNAEVFDWRKTLDLPLSAGAVAVLVEHSTEPEVQERWQTALRDGSPDIRAAAARAIYAAGATALLPALKDALAAEENKEAAAEQMRAVVSLGSTVDDPVVIAAAKRLADLRHQAWLLLGRARGIAALSYLATLREIDGNEQTRDSLVRAATRGGRSGVNEAATVALRDNDDAAWYVIWNALQHGAGVGEEFLVQSVFSPNARIRAMTYWNLAMIYAHGRGLGKPLEAALQTTPEATIDPETPAVDWPHREARFSYELLRRARGGKRREDLEWARGIAKGISPWPFPGFLLPVTQLFTAGERRILVEKEHLEKRMTDFERYYHWSPRRFNDAPLSSARTVLFTSFPKGYLTGLAALTGCRETSIRADMTYNLEGRPRTVVLRDEGALSDACREAARTVAASHPFSLFSRWNDVEGQSPEPGPETIDIQVFEPKVLAAAENAERGTGHYRDGAGAVRVGGDIPPPKLRKGTKMSVPRQKGVGGLMVADVTIGADGRVTDVKLLRGLAPKMDEAFLKHLRKTVYEPTLVDGVAVPVVMTHTLDVRAPK